MCADHDRSTGEGVGPQEYTLIKLRVLDFPGKLAALAGKDVFLAPATLRPETMYGQTNCFVLPEGDYGAYEWADPVGILIMSARSARGLAHQIGGPEEWGVPKCLLELKGSDIMGLPLSAPNATYERVYTLPLLTISMSKGTGVVTSVPSDSPDDYTALKELQDKPEWRKTFKTAYGEGLKDEWVMPFSVVPIIHIEGYGNQSAVFMCEKLKIKSCKDADKLKQAKEETYVKGFYEGVMEVGEFKGKKVCDAKPLIKAQIIQASQALVYLEPESVVMSRTNDECVVAMTDQWYLVYGQDDWCKSVTDHVKSAQFETYTKATQEKFEFVLGWLKDWACSRLFGLGTQLPWDEKWVIESLSDSTIYMSYYTIAHHFHGEANMNGDPSASPSAILASQLTDSVFDYIYLRGAAPADSAIPIAKLDAMRAEFEYWYLSAQRAANNRYHWIT